VNPFERCDRSYVLPYNQPLEFKHRALDAPDVDLLAYRGNVVVLNFFATWCPPCNAEQAGVVDVASKYFDQGLRVIGVNFREQDDQVRKYRDKYKIVYPIAMDEDGGLLARVENNDVVSDVIFPITLFLSEQGMLTCYRRGAMETDELTYKVEQMLKFLHDSGS
jgi:thiol-disulfide isomerase/thioredoxin